MKTGLSLECLSVLEQIEKREWGNINCPKIKDQILIQESTRPTSEAWARADEALKQLKPEQTISDEQVKAYLIAKHGPNYRHLNKI